MSIEFSSEEQRCWKCASKMDVEIAGKQLRFICPKCAAATAFFGSLSDARNAAFKISRYYDSLKPKPKNKD